MEALIYWAGCAALMTIAAIVIIVGVWALCLFVRDQVRKDLVSTYNHAQLKRLIKKIKKDGYSKALADLQKEEI